MLKKIWGGRFQTAPRHDAVQVLRYYLTFSETITLQIQNQLYIELKAAAIFKLKPTFMTNNAQRDNSQQRKESQVLTGAIQVKYGG